MKIPSFSVPPGYRRRDRPASKKLWPYMAWIDAILEGGRRKAEGDSRVHNKQRHTAHRIFARLPDAQGFTGGTTIVRAYVAAATPRTREMFVPLRHRPAMRKRISARRMGTSAAKRFASIIFAWICRTRMAVSSRRIQPKPRRQVYAVRASLIAKPFAMAMWRHSIPELVEGLGGVPKSILHDNSKLAVAKIMKSGKSGKRLRSKMFAELQSHYLFDDRCRPCPFDSSPRDPRAFDALRSGGNDKVQKLGFEISVTVA